MSPIRAQIREAIRARLAGGQTLAQDRVFASRITPIGDDDLPAILIYARDEKILAHSPDEEDGWIARELHLITEGVVSGSASVDDKLDLLAAQIEDLIGYWSIPGFAASTLRLFETEIDIISENVKKPIGAIGLTWILTYRTPWNPLPPDSLPDHVSRRLIGVEEDPVDLPPQKAPSFPGTLGDPDRGHLP